jgi:hypothetical protein
MTITEPEGIFHKYIFFALIIVLSVWNPFPGRLKVLKDGKFVLDFYGRIKSWSITKKELARRRAAGEEETQCYKVSSRGSVEMSGKTG